MFDSGHSALQSNGTTFTNKGKSLSGFFNLLEICVQDLFCISLISVIICRLLLLDDVKAHTPCLTGTIHLFHVDSRHKINAHLEIVSGREWVIVSVCLTCGFYLEVSNTLRPQNFGHSLFKWLKDTKLWVSEKFISLFTLFIWRSFVTKITNVNVLLKMLSSINIGFISAVVFYKFMSKETYYGCP